MAIVTGSPSFLAITAPPTAQANSLAAGIGLAQTKIYRLTESG
jgi:hypothetical protein